MVEVFPAVVLKRGQDYATRGHVLNIRLSDGLLKGRVKGGEGQIYDVHIDLRSWPSSPSKCACASRSSCEHAVACLLALQAKENIPGIPQLGLQNTIQQSSEQKEVWRMNATDFVQEVKKMEAQQ